MLIKIGADEHFDFSKEGMCSMWIVVYVAPNKNFALYIKEMLEIEGILVKFKEPLLDNVDRNVEVMVLESELEEATEVLSNAIQRP